MSSPLFADDNPNRSRGDIMELIPESYKVMISNDYFSYYIIGEWQPIKLKYSTLFSPPSLSPRFHLMATCLKRYITNGYWSREQLLYLPDCPPARPPAGVGRLGGGGRTPQATSRASELQSRAILLPLKIVAKKRWPPVRAWQQSRISVKKKFKMFLFPDKMPELSCSKWNKGWPHVQFPKRLQGRRWLQWLRGGAVPCSCYSNKS